MVPKIRIGVSNSSVNRALRNVYAKIEKQADINLFEAAYMGADAAEKGYETAKYDGDVDAEVHIARNSRGGYSIVARGESVMHIEYGTGVYNANRVAEKDYWFFTAKHPRLTATGEKVHNIYYRKTEIRSKYEFTSPLGDTQRIQKKDVASGAFNRAKMTYTDDDGNVYPVRRVRVKKKVPRYKVDKGERTNSNSYMTIGNPPNNVMRHAKSVALRTFYSHYKTRYSSYDD